MINIFYAGGTDEFVGVSYNIQLEDDIHVIRCNIIPNSKVVPYWLRPRKFAFRSRLIDGVYNPLFNDNDYINNMDTVLFIEKAYEAIMKNEKLKMLIY